MLNPSKQHCVGLGKGCFLRTDLYEAGRQAVSRPSCNDEIRMNISAQSEFHPQRFSVSAWWIQHLVFFSLNALPHCLWEMERAISYKASSTPSQLSLPSCFTSCCLPLAAAETAGRETYLHPTVWLIHGQQIARGTSNTQPVQIISSEARAARPQGTAPAHSTLRCCGYKERWWCRPVLTPVWPPAGSTPIATSDSYVWAGLPKHHW